MRRYQRRIEALERRRVVPAQPLYVPGGYGGGEVGAALDALFAADPSLFSEPAPRGPIPPDLVDMETADLIALAYELTGISPPPFGFP